MRIDQIKKAFRFSMTEVVENALLDTKEELVDVQRQQMVHGERSDGKRIGKYKNKAYASMKNFMNSKPGLGFKDLRLTGSFHKMMFVDIRENGRVIFSSLDEKLPQIIEREGELIFGINKKFRVPYSHDTLGPAIIKRINDLLK
jgi:hypothetical protein